MNTGIQEQQLVKNVEVGNEAKQIAKVHKLNMLNSWVNIAGKLSGFGDFLVVPGNTEFSRRFNTSLFSEFALSGHSSETSKLTALEDNIRIPNLWYTEIRANDSRLNFGYLRSGALVPFSIQNKEHRDQLTYNRVEVLLEAASKVKSNPEKKLRFLNIDLQTPTGAIDGSSVETISVPEQAEAFSKINNQNGIQTLNVTVDEGRYLKSDGWLFSNQTIKAIDKIINESLSTISIDILPLAFEVAKDIRDTIQSERGNENPVKRYGILSRLVVLASLGGTIVHFNCRSGKDRTGYLDAEIKFLSYQLSRKLAGYEASKIGEVVLPEEKEAWKEILLNSGNLEIQKLNTGVTGSKIDKGLLKLRVGDELWEQFIGDARKVSA